MENEENYIETYNETEVKDRKWRNRFAVGLGVTLMVAGGAYFFPQNSQDCNKDEKTINKEKVEVVDSSQTDNQDKTQKETTQKDTEKPYSKYKSDKDQKQKTTRISPKRINQLEERVSGLEEGFDSLKEKVRENSISNNKLSEKVENIGDELGDLDNQLASIYSGLQKSDNSIKDSLDELRERYVSLEKRLDKVENAKDGGRVDTVYMDSKKEAQNRGNIEKDHSRPGMSKKEDPGSKEFDGDVYWAPLARFYDCANEQIVGGTNNTNNPEIGQQMAENATSINYKGNVFANKPGIPNDPSKKISGGSPIENVLDTSEYQPTRDGFYNINLIGVEKEKICVETVRGDSECRFVQYFGKFSPDNK